MAITIGWRELAKARVRLGARSAPVWLFALVISGVGATGGYAIARRSTSDPAAASPSGSPVASSASPVAPPSAADASRAERDVAAPAASGSATLDRARLGDLESLKRLELSAPQGARDLATELAILEGRIAEAKTASATLRDDWRAHPELAEDEHARAMLRAAARRSLTAVDALAAMSEIASALGPDLLDDVASEHGVDAPILATAAALLENDAIRSRASAALRVKLDLARARTCEETKRVVTRAIDEGDARSRHLIDALGKEAGCGVDASVDCFPCLRGDDLVSRARESVRSRKPPRF